MSDQDPQNPDERPRLPFYVPGVRETMGSFTVHSIMVPTQKFIRAKDATQAVEVLKQYPEIDAVPMPEHGEPQTVYCKANGVVLPIGRKMLLSESTAIVSLPRIFLSVVPLYFVLSGIEIGGLLTVSDINNPLCKVPYFILFEAVERAVLGQIRDSFSLDSVARLISPARAKQLRRTIERLSRKDVLPHPTAALSFSDILSYARKTGELLMQDDEAEWMIRFRNRVAHPGHTLVTSIDEIARLNRTEKIALSLLN